VECIYDDLDLFDNITREDWEVLNKDVFANMETLFKSAIEEMKAMKIDVTKFHSIERLGGGSRIAMVEQLIKQTFGV